MLSDNIIKAQLKHTLDKTDFNFGRKYEGKDFSVIGISLDEDPSKVPPYAKKEKILQKLRAANIVVSHQGKQGGYALARLPSEITLKEIIEALEGGATFDIQTFGIFCDPVIRERIVCTHFSMCGLRPVWRRTKELLDQFYGSVTLEMIAQEEHQVKHFVHTNGAPGGK